MAETRLFIPKLVVTAISVDSGKTLDSEIMSRKCKGCVMMRDLETTDPTRYEDWKSFHECGLNYTRSAPYMEKVGLVNIFKRSTEKNGLRYATFYGDGDGKSLMLLRMFTIMTTLSLNKSVLVITKSG